MWKLFAKDLKMIMSMLLVKILTQTLFFIAYSYVMSGDPYLALDNFYSIMYNHW